MLRSRILASCADAADLTRGLMRQSSLLDTESTMPEHAAPALEDINLRIARRVVGLRAGCGLSLDALAARSGASRSTIALLVAEDASGAIVGTVQLVLAQPENQPDLLQDAADLTGDRAPKRGASCCHRPTRPRGRCSRASQRR
jgi:hypothetical protein